MEDSMFRRLEHKPKNDVDTVITSPEMIPGEETVIVADTPSNGPVTVPEATVDTVEEPVDPIPEPSRKPENRLSFSDEPEPRRTEPVHTPEPVPEEPHKKTAVEVVFGPNNRKKRKEEEQRALAEGKTIERPPKKSAVEVVFGPNNRKKRKEEAERALAEGRVIEQPPKKSAVEVVFGPNNRKKRKEEEQRAIAEGRTIERPPKKSAVEVVFGPNNRKKRKEEAARLESQKTFDEETSHPEPEEGKDERRLEI